MLQSCDTISLVIIEMFNELTEYLYSFHKITKLSIGLSFAFAGLIYIISMYFALSAGRTMDYYEAMHIFFVLTENAKGVIAAGVIPALIFQFCIQKYID